MAKSIKLKDKDGVVYPYPFYPVGSIYLSVLDTNPSAVFGGKWEQIAQGRTLVGVDTSQSEFNKVKKTGGAKTHVLKIEETPPHTHNLKAYGATLGSGTSGWRFGANGSTWGTGIVEQIGGGKAHNNLPPFFTCYIWLKIGN